MSGNITGLVVVISGIIKRRITIFFFCHISYGYFFRRGGYSWVVTVDYFLCSLVRKGSSQQCVFGILCIFVTNLSFVRFFFVYLSHAFHLFAIVCFHSIQSFSGGTPFVNYHVSASAGGALVSLEYLIHLFLYVRLLYILFFSVYYWTIISFCGPRLMRLFRVATCGRDNGGKRVCQHGI